MFENDLILKRNSKFLGNEAYCGKTKMVLTTPLEEKIGGEEHDGINDPQKIKKLHCLQRASLHFGNI